MIHRVLGILTLLLCVGVTGACPPVAFRANYGHGYAATYHAPVVAAYAYPAYFVAYGGSGTDAVMAEVKLLKAQLQIESLKTQLLLTQQGNGGGAPQLGRPQAQAEAAPKGEEQVRAVFQSCAECHSGAAAKGKFQMFTGNGAAKLTPDQMGECFQRVLDGDMPKGRKLSAEQKLAVLSGLSKWPAP